MTPDPFFKQKPSEELADWDPEAQQREQEAEADVEEVRERRRRLKLGLILVLCLLVLIAIWVRNCSSAPGFEVGVDRSGPSVIDLAGLEVELLGVSFEGPVLVIDAPLPNMVEVATLQQRTEIVELIGLRNEDYPGPPPAAGDEPAAEQRLDDLERFRRDALETLTREKRHLMLRMTPATEDRLARVYLVQPLDQSTVNSLNPNPQGEGLLINALALEKGVGLLEFNGGHPLHERMVDAFLLGYSRHRRGLDDPDFPSIFGRFNIQPPLSPSLEQRMALIE